jgi:hypothetical protein
VILGSFQLNYLDEREGEQPDYQGEVAEWPPQRMRADGETTQN